MKKIKVEILFCLLEDFKVFEIEVDDDVAKIALRQAREDGCFLINIALNNGAIGSSSMSISTIPAGNRQEWLRDKCLEKIKSLIGARGEK